MPECQNPEDCDDGNDCTGNACTDGMCEYTVVTDDTVCDESNECTTGMCASGECDTTPVQDGTVCGNGAGTCQLGICSNVACTEQGIRDAIAAGGGPYTFDCAGPQTVVTAAEIVIDNDVILDGEGNLTVDGNDDHLVFEVSEGVSAELTGFTVTRGRTEVGPPFFRFHGGCISNLGTLTLTNCTVTRCTAAESITPDLLNNGGGIGNLGSLTLTNCTVSENSADFQGGGIWSPADAEFGSLTLTNSTVSGNSAYTGGGIAGVDFTIENSTVSDNVATGWGGGIVSRDSGRGTITNSTVSGNSADTGGGVNCEEAAELTITNSTISGNTGGAISNTSGTVMLRNATVSGGISSGTVGEVSSTVTAATLIDGVCVQEGDGVTWTSNGYNLESPGDTCGFDPDKGDQINVSTDDLNLGALANNGGPTMTHKPGDGGLREGSVAIDQIPEADCEVGTDQRGQPRPAGPDPKRCDVGSVEVQGSIKSGLWLGGNPASNTDGTPFDTGWAICFFVNEDRTALIPSTECDIDGNDDEAYVLELSWKNDVGAGTVQGEVGICNANPEEGSESIGIGDSYPFEDAFGVGAVGVPIEDSSFAIPLGFLFPDVEITGGEIIGTFDGDTASGTANWEWAPGMGYSQCELDGGWTASPAP